MMSLEAFARAVYTYAQGTGASCTSWGRTTAHNRAVGGVNGGPHVAWLGVDLIYDGPPPEEAAAQSLARAVGLLLVREPDHDHCQPGDWSNTP